MAIREVLQLGHPLLREVAAPGPDPTAPEVAATLEDMRDTLAHWNATTTYGRGIAAPQIGVSQRLVFINIAGREPWPLINPEIIAASEEKHVIWDACLSFLTIFYKVYRHTSVRVRYQDLTGAWHEMDVEGDLGDVLQHEIDHLNGVLALDRLVDVGTIVSRQEFERQFRAESRYAPGRF